MKTKAILTSVKYIYLYRSYSLYLEKLNEAYQAQDANNVEGKRIKIIFIDIEYDNEVYLLLKMRKNRRNSKNYLNKTYRLEWK